jgi:zinc transport system permease protein
MALDIPIIMPMFEIFQYGFMIRALAAGAAVAVLAPTIGMFLVTRRYAFMADTLAHVALAGVVFGLLVNVPVIIMALIADIAVALAVEKLRRSGKVFGEAGLAMFLSGSLAVASVLLSAAHGLNVSLSSVLFGSITTVTREDVLLVYILGFVVLGIVTVFYKEFFALSLDEDLAEASGLRTSFFSTALVVLAAITVALAMRVIGVLLVGALMVIPVLAATQWRMSFKRTLFLAIAVALVSVLLGLILSFQFSTASGGTIVLCCIAMFAVSFFSARVTLGK